VVASGNILKPDIMNSEFILYLGAYPGHSGKPMQSIARQAAVAASDGKLKFVVVDPVMVGGAVSPIGDKTKWIPIKPTTDSAFVMAIIRWMIENNRHNVSYLSAPNLEAAIKKGFNSFTNASHLVITDPNHPNYKLHLRPEDLGLNKPVAEDDYFVVIDKVTANPALYIDSTEADLYFDGTVNDANGNPIKVSTSFIILKDQVFQHDLTTYAKKCGITETNIIEIAKELTSYGTKVGIDGMGNTAAANGVNASLGLYALAAMVGCFNKKGGMLPRRLAFKAFGAGPRYDLANYPGKGKPQGIRISRTGVPYEATPEYKNKVAKGENPYPSKMPWHPIGSASDNQAMFSIINGYPYQAKALMVWMANPLITTPATARASVLEQLKKVDNVPLIISIDAFMGEMTSLADYIIPDTTQYESWGLPNIEGNVSGKGQSLRWPVVQPITTKLANGRYACFENYVIDIAKKINVPGFGDKAIPDMATGKLYPLNKPEDYFLRAITNLAYDMDAVPDISAKEIAIQNLEKELANWKTVLKPDELKKAAYVISRGGRFENYGKGFNGDNHIYGYKGSLNIYSERLATAKNSFTGEPVSTGVLSMEAERFADGTELEQIYTTAEWPFKGVSYKGKFRSNSTLVNSNILRDLSPTNQVEINPNDAKQYGFKTGDKVKLVSASGDESIGTLLVRQGIAKGSIGIAYGYGHWEYGSKAFQTGEQKVGGDNSRSKGILLSSIIDPTVKEGIFGLSEMATGGPARNGCAYRLERV